MNGGTGFKSGQNSSELQAIAAAVRDLALGCQGDSLALVSLLRRLEELHREIRDGIFQTSLPDNRQALYVLLKDIETQGGWPYIERMRLQSFLANLPVEEVGGDEEKAVADGVMGGQGDKGSGGVEDKGTRGIVYKVFLNFSLIPDP